MSEPLLLHVSEAAELLGLSRSKTYELVAAGVIPSVKIGKSVRIPRQELLDWIRANTRGGHAAA